MVYNGYRIVNNFINYVESIKVIPVISNSKTLYPQSYVSFEYALFYHAVINQVPTSITVATAHRSRKVLVGNWTIEYTHLKSDLIFNYTLEKHAFIATPEKALVDIFYTIARGQRLVELDTLNEKKINQKHLEKILHKFPSYVSRTAQKYLLR